jgi:hypothetical protein
MHAILPYVKLINASTVLREEKFKDARQQRYHSGKNERINYAEKSVSFMDRYSRRQRGIIRIQDKFVDYYFDIVTLQ